MLERHPSLIHIQNVIHKDYVSLLRNDTSRNPRALRFATTAPKDALAFANACDENLIGLIGLFGYRSLEETKIALSPEQQPAPPTRPPQPQPQPSTPGRVSGPLTPPPTESQHRATSAVQIKTLPDNRSWSEGQDEVIDEDSFRGGERLFERDDDGDGDSDGDGDGDSSTISLSRLQQADYPMTQAKGKGKARARSHSQRNECPTPHNDPNSGTSKQKRPN